MSLFDIPGIKPASEALDFQSPNCHKELSALINEYRNKTREALIELPDMEFWLPVEINTRTNLPLKLDLASAKAQHFISTVERADVKEVVTKYFNEFRSKAQDLIKKYTNISVFFLLEYTGGINEIFGMEVELNKHSTARLLPYHIGQQEALLSKHLNTETNTIDNPNAFMKDLKKDKDFIGSIDLKTGKVSGIFAKNENVIHIGVGMWLDDTYQYPEHMAAAILHEVGHIFTGYEYIAETRTFNHVLRGIVDTTISDMDFKNKVTLIREFSSLCKWNRPIDAVKVAGMASPNAVGMYLTAEMTITHESETDTREYDTNTIEALADQYAVRMGAGKYLMEGLLRSYALLGIDVVKQGRSQNRATLTADIIQVLSAITVAGSTAGMIMTGGFLNIAYMCIGYLGFGFGSTISRNNSAGGFLSTYDQPLTRLERIRNDLVTLLKDPDQDSKVIQETIDTIGNFEHLFKDRVLRDGVVNHYLSLISNMFNSAVLKRDRQENIIRELEKLASNDLFIRSAELRMKAQARGLSMPTEIE